MSFTTYNFNCPKFIVFLKNYVESLGVTFIRRKLSHLDEAWNSPTTTTVFNCVGISAAVLEGVKDPKVYPTRGQVAIVKRDHVQENRVRWGAGYATYIIPRPYSGGHVVLGGYMQKDNWTGDTFSHETDSILKRTNEILPSLQADRSNIIREAAGLRPSRVGGARVERENLPGGKVLIHNYGAGGAGFQSGYGMALKSVRLLNDSKI